MHRGLRGPCLVYPAFVLAAKSRRHLLPPDLCGITQPATTGYEVAVTLDDDLLWKLTHLPEECTSWVIPDQDATQSDQFKLFAA